MGTHRRNTECVRNLSAKSEDYNNVEEYIKDIKWTDIDLINLVQDGIQRHAFVNTVVDLLISQNEIILSG
jgi:hypothetical protein